LDEAKGFADVPKGSSMNLLEALIISFITSFRKSIEGKAIVEKP
jgi:hypothetical protein